MSNDLPRIRKESGVFGVEIEKIKPNSMQPRQVFDEERLKDLSDSIRQYGVLQPLVVIRKEKDLPNGTIVEYELIAGERRWRASKMAGLTQVPVIIREDPSEQVKLELALIENLQREDLGPIERAEAFSQLIDQFKMRHHEVGAKMGKSREFVSNTLRLLTLPEEIQDGLKEGLISEGHTRPLLSLKSYKDDQMGLYKEIIYKRMTVRDAESLARDIVRERKEGIRAERRMGDPESLALQEKLSNALGARVSVEKRGPVKKKISFEFNSENELREFLSKMGVAGGNSDSNPVGNPGGNPIVLADTNAPKASEETEPSCESCEAGSCGSGLCGSIPETVSSPDVIATDIPDTASGDDSFNPAPAPLSPSPLPIEEGLEDSKEEKEQEPEELKENETVFNAPNTENNKDDSDKETTNKGFLSYFS